MGRYLYNYTVMSVRTLRFPAKLNRITHAALERFLEDQRNLWNAALQERSDAYRKCGKAISAYDQCKSLTAIRRDDPQHYARIAVHAQRSILFRLDKAFKAFFGRVKRGEKPGFPRYRSRRRAVRSFETDAFRVHRQGSWQAVTIKGIGRFRFRGEIDGWARVLRIVRSPRRVEVQIVVELAQQDIADDARAPVGIDVGIRARVALSGGEIVPGNPLDRAELRQRRVSRAQRGSKSRRKKVCALAKEWQRVTERERGRLHELTSRLVREQGPRFHVEALRILNMTKNHRLARAILEQTLGRLCVDARLQSGRRWWVGAQGARASHVATVLRLRGTAVDARGARGAHVSLRWVPQRCRPRRQCGKEHPLGRACARLAGRGTPGVPGGGRRAEREAGDGRGAPPRHGTVPTGGLT